jgi:tetratricopeptide (TPR) repeat protein
VLNDEEPALRAALARFNVAWADALAQSESEADTRGRRFELLSAALLLDPNYAPIFDRMMKILAEKSETSDAAKEFLLGNVTGGPTMGLSHLLLGSSAFAADDAATAAYHLERAYELLPNAYIVTNNLAWFLAFKDPPDLNRGLDLINNVLKRAPNDPRFLDTRGQIYTKLQRWDEAIGDLERALQQGLPGAETHEALATCYGAKGLPELERRHRQLADSEKAK